jgi:hypothetical protein
VLLSVGGFAVNAGVAVAEERQASVPSASSTYESTAYAYDEFAGAYDAAAYTYDGSAGLSSPHATAVAERGSPTRPAAVWLGWSVVADGVVDAANTADELAEIGFRSDTSHIFRNATGHLARDTAENRALIKSALDPANLRDAITLKNGTTLQKYFRDLPDGTQAWAEVRNGQITNGGLNVFPR